MGYSKIYAHLANGAKTLNTGTWLHEVTFFFDEHIITSTKDGDAYLVAIPKHSAAREMLANIQGVTLLPSPSNPDVIKKEHHAILSKHGVLSTDTNWQAIKKLHQAIGTPGYHGDLTDPDT